MSRIPLISAAITGTGSCLPEAVFHNREFEKTLDTSSEWILQRTGIEERHIAAAHESSATLGLEAAKRAIAAANLTPRDIDLIICATITPEMMFPSTACHIQAGLGCDQIGAFDLAAACSGFVYALTTSYQFLASGTYKHILVVGAETLSRVTDFTDRTTCILFGDGAGAVVLSAERPATKSGLLFHRLYADGSRPDLMALPGGGSKYPASTETIEQGMHFMRLKGREVYRFAVTKMQQLIAEALDACKLSLDDIALIIPHQVNQRIIDSAIEELNIDPSKVMVNIRQTGNTSAASIPIALDEARRTQRVKSGDTVLFVAFGGGLTWASAVVTM